MITIPDVAHVDLGGGAAAPWAQSELGVDLTVWTSDVGTCICVTGPAGLLCEPREKVAKLKAGLSHLIGWVTVGLEDARLVRPITVVVAPDFQEGADAARQWTTSFEQIRTWAAEQAWHRGRFSLFLAPPVAASVTEWSGPRRWDEMIRHLIGAGPAAPQDLPAQPENSRQLVLRALRKDGEGSPGSEAEALVDLIQRELQDDPLSGTSPHRVNAEQLVEQWLRNFLDAEAES